MNHFQQAKQAADAIAKGNCTQAEKKALIGFWVANIKAAIKVGNK